MLSWFEKHAPIRVKFKMLLGIHAALALVGLGTTWGGLAHAASPTLLLTSAGAAVLATIFVVWLSARLICTPYVNTVVRMEGLAAGDVSTDIPYADHRDCVGRMTKAMGVFRDNAEAVQRSGAEAAKVVASLGEGLSRMAAKDLSSRIEQPFPPAYEKLREDFNAAIAELASMMAAVSESVEGIATGSGEIRQASDDLSQRTEQQAASLEQTAAAMDEITAGVRDTAKGAGEANRAVGAAREEALQSGEVVRRAVEAMGGIERTSSEISEIISVIDGIAFQTNLLALNAGVEAARAGDAGRGFAMVASEVRALAQRSADAAKDVKARITASVEQVGVGVTLVSQAGTALERIIGQITGVSTLVSTIAASAEQQASGLGQVNTAVAEMDGVTQQNAAMVEEATAAAASLASEADALAREVAAFKLAANAAGRTDAARPPRSRTPVLRAVAPKSRPARRAGVALATASAANEDDWSTF